jgi:hypothetical protein
MSLYEVLDVMDEMLDKAWGLPLSGGKSVVDIERLRDLMGDIRMNTPIEIKRAAIIEADKENLLINAKKEAEAIIRRAEERAKQLINAQEITKQAEAKAHETLTVAQNQAREFKRESKDFVDEMLRQVEEKLIKNVTEIKTARQSLRKPTVPQ